MLQTFRCVVGNGVCLVGPGVEEVVGVERVVRLDRVVGVADSWKKSLASGKYGIELEKSRLGSPKLEIVFRSWF